MEGRSPASDLSDDLLVEIISRLPYKSTWCCKCVCRRWRDLISHPDHSKKLPRSTLAGFFYEACDLNRYPYLYRDYHSVSGNWCPHIDPFLSFLPRYEGSDVNLLDCCNGLVLCQRWGFNTFDYVVCNPATEKQVAVPATDLSSRAPVARIGFDPAASAHFHVFEFEPVCGWDASKGCYTTRIQSVGIYSSEAGVWTNKRAWDRPIALDNDTSSAFLDGVLYLSSYLDFVIATVDVEGNCSVIRYPTPDICKLDVYLSRGQLYLATYGCSELSIWALENSSSKNWILKHNVSHLQLFGEECSLFERDYCVISHPEQNLIFIVCTKALSYRQSVTKLMSYELDSRELQYMCDLGCCRGPYLSYVPYFSKSLAYGHGKS